VGRLAAPGDAVSVVQFRRAIEAEAGTKSFRRQKAAPFFVEQDAIGLDAVPYPPAGGPVLALQVDGFAEEVHAQSSGLLAMPREVDLRPARGLDVLDDVFFQQGFGHAERAGIRIEAAFVPVVAVLAIEIAHGPGRLDEYLKLSHGTSRLNSILERRSVGQDGILRRVGNPPVAPVDGVLSRFRA